MAIIRLADNAAPFRMVAMVMLVPADRLDNALGGVDGVLYCFQTSLLKVLFIRQCEGFYIGARMRAVDVLESGCNWPNLACSSVNFFVLF